MAKINTTNYQPVTAWNGTQDLLIVEQPVGTKVATPEQVKQYVLSDMDDVPTENSNAPVKSGGIKTAIDNSVSLKTATGNPITLTDAANANAEELSMTIEPIQSGSGDPSPTNVRPISGISTASVQTTNGEDTNTASITLGQTVYGGSVNFKTGEVTVTHGIVDMGSLTYNTGSNMFYVMMDSIGAKQTEDSIRGLKSSIYTNGGMRSNGQLTNYMIASNSTRYFYIKDPRTNNIAELITLVTGQTLCYELATPTTLTLTPAELELLKGNNTITANGAEISLSYYPDNAIGVLAGRVDDKADITYVNNKVKKLATRTIQYISTSSNLEYTGVNVSCPTGHTYIVRAKCDWDNGYTASIAASDSSTDVSTWRRFAYGDSAYITFMLNEGETAYIWGKWSVASKNRVHLSITDITI